MAIKHLTEEQIRDWSLEKKDRWWFENVWKGNMPQLTLRSGLTGFFLGGILSATNLYVGAKTGWTLGVGITSVILAFAMFKVLGRIGMKEITLLENNCMQSIATAAGYMTAPMISSIGAYMLVTNQILDWHVIMIWIICIALLGVLFAFPMKRRF
ncbi:MAG: OPT/YSL family transporter, partial [Planctomycetota bacterium]